MGCDWKRAGVEPAERPELFECGPDDVVVALQLRICQRCGRVECRLARPGYLSDWAALDASQPAGCP